MKVVIDNAPTWQGILPALLILLADGSPDGKRIAKEELTNMAKLADMHVTLIQPTTNKNDVVTNPEGFIVGQEFSIAQLDDFEKANEGKFLSNDNQEPLLGANFIYYVGNHNQSHTISFLATSYSDQNGTNYRCVYNDYNN